MRVLEHVAPPSNPAIEALPSGAGRLDGVRMLMYSHDTFGLGHLRRCRTIAHALVERFKGLHVLIVCGSQIAGAFDFRARVDFIKVPSVIKLYNGEYTSIGQHIDLQETLALRKSIILSTARSFKPDIMLVDKEPLGLRGELEPTLTYLRSIGCHLALGLRDVMDAPRLLSAEWAKSGVIPKMDALYDSVWIYGPRDFHDPLAGLDIPASMYDRLVWTGWLRREVTGRDPHGPAPRAQGALLVTAGGGGDGAELMRQVMAAYEHDPSLRKPMLMVLGPFMGSDEREELRARAARNSAVTVLDFDNQMEALIAGCAGVVGMGGYNTFCEVLSLDKRCLIVPRVAPREEQLIRAKRAAELGLVDMLMPEAASDPAVMARALHALARRPLPSQAAYPVDLDGLDRIGDLVQAATGSRDGAGRTLAGPVVLAES